MLSILGMGLVVLGLLKKHLTIEIKPETRRGQPFLQAPLAYIAIPKVERKVFIGYKTVTAYDPSNPNQTDDSPCISASNQNICISQVKTVATNRLPFGTRIEIDGIEYEVQDRMNRRYPNRYDLAMLKGAKEWGIKVLPVYIVE